jgi:phosphoglucosamine mutase
MDKKQKLSYLLKDISLFPQKTLNLTVKNKSEALSNKKLKSICTEIENDLKDNGSILVRASGTEPKIRIMIECNDMEKMNEYFERIEMIINEENLDG